MTDSLSLGVLGYLKCLPDHDLTWLVVSVENIVHFLEIFQFCGVQVFIVRPSDTLTFLTVSCQAYLLILDFVLDSVSLYFW